MIVKTPYGTWRVQVKYRSVVVADRTFERKGDAVRWEMEQKRLLQSGEFVSPSAGRITVRELAEEYRDSRQGQVSVRAWESDESALRVHIVPAFGKLPISSVSSVQIERFLTDLAVSRSVRTAARVRTTLRGLFRYAVRTRRLRRRPPRTCRCPVRTRGRARSWRSSRSRSTCCSASLRTQRETGGPVRRASLSSWR